MKGHNQALFLLTTHYPPSPLLCDSRIPIPGSPLMLTWLRDTLDTVRLRARYRRLVQEQLLALAEDQRPRPVSDEAGGWTLAGSGKAELDALNRDELRTRARRLIRTNPYARNLVRLLEVYVVGPGLKVTPAPIPSATISPDVLQVADRLWRSFLQLNRAHFSFREHARRAWRDGECFLRLFRQVEWPPTVRFVDPELIGSPTGAPDDDGLVSALRTTSRRCWPTAGWIRRPGPKSN